MKTGNICKAVLMTTAILGLVLPTVFASQDMGVVKEQTWTDVKTSSAVAPLDAPMYWIELSQDGTLSIELADSSGRALLTLRSLDAVGRFQDVDSSDVGDGIRIEKFLKQGKYCFRVEGPNVQFRFRWLLKPQRDDSTYNEADAMQNNPYAPNTILVMPYTTESVRNCYDLPAGRPLSAIKGPAVLTAKFVGRDAYQSPIVDNHLYSFTTTSGRFQLKLTVLEGDPKSISMMAGWTWFKPHNGITYGPFGETAKYVVKDERPTKLGEPATQSYNLTPDSSVKLPVKVYVKVDSSRRVKYDLSWEEQ